MNTLHLANTNFEWELLHNTPFSSTNFYRVHHHAYQLQFLPFLYGKPEDGVVVTDHPPDGYFESLEASGFTNLPKLHLFSELEDLKYDRIESWGGSMTVKKISDELGIPYKIPPLSLLQEVSSKEFTFKHCPQLPGSKLLSSEREAKEWIESTPGPKVLKSPHGFSGRGNTLINDDELKWEEELRIGEPWMDRVFDFSTQWEINELIQFLGATQNETTKRGFHISNSVGDLQKFFGQHLPFLEEQKKESEMLLSTLQELGYFGPVGIDAMIYEGPKLRSIVEINPRKTMGRLALELHKKFPQMQVMKLNYAKSAQTGLLPSHLEIQGWKKLSFSQQLWIGDILTG